MHDDTVSPTKLEMVVTLIRDAQKRNAAIQVRQRVGGTTWHEHESLDDKLHDALELLGA